MNPRAEGIIRLRFDGGAAMAQATRSLRSFSQQAAFSSRVLDAFGRNTTRAMRSVLGFFSRQATNVFRSFFFGIRIWAIAAGAAVSAFVGKSIKAFIDFDKKLRETSGLVRAGEFSRSLSSRTGGGGRDPKGPGGTRITRRDIEVAMARGKAAAEAEYKAYSKAIIAMATQVRRTPQELAGGIYEVAQAGFTRPSNRRQGLQILRAGAQGAAAGGGQTKDAVRSLITIANSLSLGMTALRGPRKGLAGGAQALGTARGGLSASQIMDKIFQAISAGIGVEFTDLNRALGRVVGPAGAFMNRKQEKGRGKQILDEIMGVMITGTQAGMQPSTIGIGYTNMLQKIMKPSAKAMKLYEKIGIKPGEGLLSGLLFGDGKSGKSAIEKIKGALERAGLGGGKMNESLSVLFGDVRGLRLLTTINQQYAKMPANLALVRDAAGSAHQAWLEQGKSLQGQIDNFKALWETVKLGLGAAAMPAISKAVSWGASYIEKITGGAGGAQLYATYEAQRARKNPKLRPTRKEYLKGLKTDEQRRLFKAAERFNTLDTGGQLKRIGGIIWDDLDAWARRPSTHQQFRDIMTTALNKGLELLAAGAKELPGAYQIGLDLVQGIEQGIRDQVKKINLKNILSEIGSGGGGPGSSFMGSKDPWDKANASIIALIVAKGLSSKIKGGGLVGRGMRGGIFGGSAALAGVPDQLLPIIAAAGALMPQKPTSQRVTEAGGRGKYGLGRFLFGWPRRGGGGGGVDDIIDTVAPAARASSMTTQAMVVTAKTVVVSGPVTMSGVGGGGLAPAASTRAAQQATQLYTGRVVPQPMPSPGRSSLFAPGNTWTAPSGPRPTAGRTWWTGQPGAMFQPTDTRRPVQRPRDAQGRFLPAPTFGPQTAHQAIVSGNYPYTPQLPVPTPAGAARAGAQNVATYAGDMSRQTTASLRRVQDAYTKANTVAEKSLKAFARGGASAAKGSAMVLGTVATTGTTATKTTARTVGKGVKGIKGAAPILASAALGGGITAMSGADIASIAGAAAGAGIGSLAGPIGTVVGGSIGAIAGQKIAEWLDKDSREKAAKKFEAQMTGFADQMLSGQVTQNMASGLRIAMQAPKKEGGAGIKLGGSARVQVEFARGLIQLAHAKKAPGIEKAMERINLAGIAMGGIDPEAQALINVIQQRVMARAAEAELFAAQHPTRKKPKGPQETAADTPTRTTPPKRRAGPRPPGWPVPKTGPTALGPHGRGDPAAAQAGYEWARMLDLGLLGLPGFPRGDAADAAPQVRWAGVPREGQFPGFMQGALGVPPTTPQALQGGGPPIPGAMDFSPATTKQRPYGLLDVAPSYNAGVKLVDKLFKPVFTRADEKKKDLQARFNVLGSVPPKQFRKGFADTAKAIKWDGPIGTMYDNALAAAIRRAGGDTGNINGNGSGGGGESPGEGIPPTNTGGGGSSAVGITPSPTGVTPGAAVAADRGLGQRAAAGALGRSFAGAGGQAALSLTDRIARNVTGDLFAGPMGNAATALGWLHSQVGKPYIWGGGHPPAPGLAGYDCSGLASTALQMAGIGLAGTTGTMLPHIKVGGQGPIVLGFNSATSPSHMGINVLGNWFEAKGRASGILGPGAARSSWAVTGTPEYHKGGLFRSAMPGGEGLAMLKDKELVVDTDGARLGKGGGGPTIVIHNMSVRNKSDAHEFAAELARLLEQRSGNS